MPPLLEREIAYQRLKRLLLSGRLRPEEPLSERGLAARLRLGRMPVREVQREGTRLHQALVRAAGNRELARIYQALDARIALSLRLTAEHRPARSREANGEHLEILSGPPRPASSRRR